MSRARQLIEGIEDPDSPESFGIGQHLNSPVASLLSKNGFQRSDRHDDEERWVKKLRNGNEVWMIAYPELNPKPIDYRDPRQHGGRNWTMIMATRTNKCSVCQGHGAEPGGGPGSCQPCRGTGKQKKAYYEHNRVLDGNELTMNALLGAILQRLATWPAHLPKPGERLFQ